MTATAKGLLGAFDTLDPAERQEVAAEILRRSAGSGDLSDPDFEKLADEVFAGYDAEEESNANGDAR